MRSTRIVTAFVRNDQRLLLLRRSRRVRTMKGMWSGVSGIIEGDESPLYRARTEILEETGMAGDAVSLVRAAKRMRIGSPQYANHEWVVFPFLFEARDRRVRLNWENSDYRWIAREELGDYRTVPSLERVLLRLL